MNEQETRYTREELLKSKRFARYQKDFLSAILTHDTYTLEEAEQAVMNFYQGE